MKRFFINLVIALSLFFIFCIAVRLYPHEKLLRGVPVSVAVYADKGELLRLFLASDGHYRLWLPLEDIPHNLKEATLLYEDSWFYYHPGFNPISLGRALWQTYISGGARQGASTITMQLARLRYRLNTRTIGGKLRQIWKAVELELCYSKGEILEAYLNTAPYGRNIEGVGAASLIYFSKNTKDLNLTEVLSLAVLPQAPTQRMREGANFARKSQTLLNKSLNGARGRLFASWVQRHREADSESAAFALPLSINPPEQLAFSAPHFTQQVYDTQMLKGVLPYSIKTTLNLHLQKLLEQRINSFLQASSSRGLGNAAAILIDYRTMQVKALVGSGDYFNKSIGGQINGTNINRSPGSTLKPFIYALGLEQGIISPRTMLKDVPTSFGPYTPSNFDQKFLGPISVEEALIRSRNIPAVYVGSQLKSPSLYEFLRSAGLSHLASEGKYGLALMLGGGDISMQELASLYCVLANNGAYYPLQFNEDAAKPEGRQLLTPESAFITLDMLSAPRPGDTTGQGEKVSVAWKTGTSWGFRDAWCAGVFGPYVLVVWLGNFDNSSNSGLIGVEAAAPLFFGIIDAVVAEKHVSPTARAVPAGVKKVSVCLSSGNLPTVWCHNLIDTWYIPGKSPIRVDTIHRPVYFSKKTGEVACPPYDMEDTSVKVYEFWPSDLATAFKKAGLPRVTPPQNPLCKSTGAATIPPKIISPLKKVSYIKYKKDGPSDRIPLKATTDAGIDRVYWFIGNSYFATVKSGEDILWVPDRPGKYSLTVVDDHGNFDSRNIDILEGVSF